MGTLLVRGLVVRVPAL